MKKTSRRHVPQSRGQGGGAVTRLLFEGKLYSTVTNGCGRIAICKGLTGRPLQQRDRGIPKRKVRSLEKSRVGSKILDEKGVTDLEARLRGFWVYRNIPAKIYL